MIPSPKLDDRKYQDIVDEAISLIPRYAPEWTNHNPADPGITLLELAAWMTDLLVTRLNQVPEKNYVAFLNLLGIKLHAPRAAKALLQFKLTEGVAMQRVPTGSQAQTPQAGDDSTVTFETAREAVITSVALDRCFSSFENTYADNSRYANPDLKALPEGGFEVFAGAQRIDRYIYLMDPRFAGVGESALLRVYLGCPERGGRDLARMLEWQYWNGERWKEMIQAPIEVDRGEVAFFGPMAFVPTMVNDVEGLWIRGRLAEVPDPRNQGETEIDTIRTRVEVAGEGVLPEKAFANLDNGAFIPLDLGKNTFPFGKEPKPDCVLYLACDELVQTPEAYISIDLQLADQGAFPRPAPSDQLVLAWEFWDGKRWRFLGRSSPRGILPGAGDEYGYHDDTRAISQSGVVSFRRPKDMETVDINGEVKRWIRCRIEKGDYGVPPEFALEGDKWITKDERPLRPPALRSISLKYREDYRDVKAAMTYNDFAFTDVTEVARTEYTIFQPFTPKSDESPALYLGFAAKLPNEHTALYFQMEEELGLGSLPSDEADVLTPELTQYETMKKLSWESEQRVVWEYYNGKSWEALPATDDTAGFTGSGFVSFIAPDDLDKTAKFTEERYWVRARLEMGGYVKFPRVRRILSNVVEAYHHQTINDEVLGNGDGTPLQQYKLLHGPVLSGEVLEVRERETPREADLADLGPNPVRKAEPDNADSNEVWVRWRQVDSFFESTPTSRHYTIDYLTGTVAFGDGRRGMAPPTGRNGVVMRTYKIGGGATGNVNTGTITSMVRALSYIDTVTNPLPATGGSDRESVEDAKRRAPYTIKSRDRAVTAEDFEMLALRASTSLARAKCVPDRSNRGQITLVLIPKAETRAEDLNRRLLPSHEIMRYIKRYLDERRLVGTIVNVIKPRYKDLSIKVTLLRRTVGTSDRLRREIEIKLRRFLHPLFGGRDGKGWEFGRPVLKSDLVHYIEEIPGVDGVDSIDIRDEHKDVTVEHVRIDDDELPFLINVNIAEKVRDDIR
ncbi:MAG: putative baseplate assembly protein [Kofleriaceae bacterium]|nr:putative baseplate assembly protein [Kofleriaceae bacterium]MBP9171599.1 putative baseplate assembly protein [Kofleriaceae bacterium]MBP9858938.1 putative baseplate assembly protein [Kofleriaceae bacterium]